MHTYQLPTGAQYIGPDHDATPIAGLPGKLQNNVFVPEGGVNGHVVKTRRPTQRELHREIRATVPPSRETGLDESLWK